MKPHTLISLGALLAMASTAPAALTESEVDRLGQDLTPLGAERAGNLDGTIPPWEGGLTTPPTGYQPGMHHPDPFAGDEPLFRIDADNFAQYGDKLTEGHKALLETYGETYFIPVYPTRRSAAVPEHIYAATEEIARNARLVNDGSGITGAVLGVPFPIPETGLEVIWNHLLRYRGESTIREVGQVAPTRSGDYTLVILDEKILYNYTQPGQTADGLDNILAYFLQEVESPARLAGSILLVHETLDQVAEPRNAWVYNTGQRRVRRAPNVAYDNPGTASDGMRTSDQLDMFNGAPNRYDWKLLGKREVYVPYNSYRLHSDELDVDDIVQPLHINQDVTRYELHRCWVVEATLKPDTRHIYARRVFYVDEDSWQILVVEQYDSRGDLWRVSEGHPIVYYEVPTLWTTLEVHYDLQSGRYLAFGLDNELSMYEFNVELDPDEFTPAALRRAGRR